MSDITIRVEGLSKQYRIGAKAVPYLTLRDSLSGLGAKVFGFFSSNGQKDHEQTLFWALKDVSFEVKQGEVIGVIGRNGAGKTTLLKILSRITEPTEGRVEIHGRIASLLEVGTGFHPELTGRENIYLNGAILGMKKAEIERKFDEIVAFAEVDKFIDTPVKYYSSGMYVRLAFAVAAHLEPDILLVDEVLAVGDANFQKKCLGKMGEVARQGRTVLFVSHNMEAVQRLCPRALLLNEGSVIMDGPSEKTVEEYLEVGISQGERLWKDMAQAPGNEIVRLLGIRSKNHNGAVCYQFDVRDPVVIEIEYAVLKEGYQLCATLEFQNAKGQGLFVSHDNYISGPWNRQSPCPAGFYRATCFLPGDFLTGGDIVVSLRIFSPPGEPNNHPHVRELETLRFSVSDGMDPGGVRAYFPYNWGSVAVRPRFHWHTESFPREKVMSGSTSFS